MRNLCHIRLDVCLEAADVSAACWDAASDEVIVAFGPTAEDMRVRLARVVGDFETCQDIASWDALSPHFDVEVDRIVSLHHFGDLATTCVVMAGGDIVMAREDDSRSGTVHIEIVGSVDAGIVAARWSPDEEVLALVTGRRPPSLGVNADTDTDADMPRSLLLMSRAFEAIGETPLTPADLAASKHVSVGWGKKETQFHGKGAAKAMRDPTIPERIDAGRLHPDDDGTAATISWRGDGEYVAVNAVEAVPRQEGEGKGGLTRRIRVFSREGALDSTSEPVDYLESSLSWRPEGSLLAAIQRQPDQTGRTVVFFERNGLRHGEFPLRTPVGASPCESAPTSVDWNTDSTVLAITYASAVQLWTTGNYHWYLKQEVSTAAAEEVQQVQQEEKEEQQQQLTKTPSRFVTWHPEKPLRLLAATGRGLSRAEYVFAVAGGSLAPPQDHGTVAVVDGCLLKLTPMRIANMPPPMSMFDVPLRRPPVDVALVPGDSALVVLYRTGIDVFSWAWPESAGKTAFQRPQEPVLTASVDWEDRDDTGSPLPRPLFTPIQVEVEVQTASDEAVGEEAGQPRTVVSVLGHQHGRNTLRVASFQLSLSSSVSPASLTFLSESTTVTAGSVFLPVSQESNSSTGSQACLYLQDPSGTVSQLAMGAADAEALLHTRLPGLLPWASIVPISRSGDDNDMYDAHYDGFGHLGGGDDTSTALLAVGLSRTGQLYANERLLAKNCTSFVVTPDHLVFTTGSHLIKFVHLYRVVDGDSLLSVADSLAVPLDDPETDERCRSIERGARLVTAMPSSLSVVLQMPRGNLETIYPRALVLAGIRKRIDALDYSQAFAFCRTQRVDMNILYDHKPAQFLAHVDLFLQQLGSVTYIDLFLSALKEEDVSQTMYKDTRSRPSLSPPPHPPLSSDSPDAQTPTSKVNAVCDAVLSSLQKGQTPSAAQLQNIITAHVCKAPPALDDGLRVVAQLLDAAREKKERRAGSDSDSDLEQLADQAVEHICFLVDVNRLYDHALGLYDLRLAMAVAQQSQRDPREYVPFLQSLHATAPEARRRFVIDDHLERRERALGHLQALGSAVFPELVDYVERHRLYADALRLFRYSTDKAADRDVLTLRYAAFLETQSRFREAGLAYESLGPAHLAAATRCFQSAGVACWRECLFAAQQQQQPPLTAEALCDLASTLADALVEGRDYAAAAAVHLDYLGPEAVDGAVRLLCRGYEFAEAMRVAVLRGRADLLATAVDAGLADALSSSTELLADCRAQLRAQVPRILELRRKAAQDPLAFYEGEGGGGGANQAGDVPDDVSVAASSRLSTSGSLFTRYSTGQGTTATGHTKRTGQTGQTTKSQQRSRKKREEKKRARGRKGTVYEQAYLVGSVRRLVERIEQARTEVAQLVAGLVRRDMAERARAMEALMAELVEACQGAIAAVWPAGGAGGAGAARGENKNNGEDEEEEQQPAAGQVDTEPAPVLAAFHRLSLLG